MTHASDRFSVALSTVRREVEAGLRGNAYYIAAQQVQDIAALAGARPANAAHTAGFGVALRELRSAAQADFTGNAFYAISGQIDRLALIAGIAGLDTAAPEPAAEHPPEPAQLSPLPMSQTPARSMDDLAAASRARLDEIAASLGLPQTRPVYGSAEPALEADTAALARETDIGATQQAETLADGELERRSSEPCSMPGAGDKLETVQAASLPADPVSGARVAVPPPDLGSSDAPAGGERQPEPASIAAAPQESAAAPAAQPAAQQNAPAAAPARPDVTAPAVQDRRTAAEVEVVPREQKSLFALWLDIVFGRKRAGGRGEN